MRWIIIFALTMPLLGAAQGLKRAVVETKTGGYLTFTNDSVSFTIHLDTASIVPYEEESSMYLAVNGKYVLQIFTLPLSKKQLENIGADDQNKEVLATYMKYETGYFRNELKLSLDSLKTKWGMINLRRFLHWEFNTPEFETINTQLHLSTICLGHIITINVPVTPDITYDDAYTFIQWVASRMQVNDYPIDFEEFSKEVNGL